MPERITDSKSLEWFLRADAFALDRSQKRLFSKAWIAETIVPDYVWRFQVLLRKLEYWTNQPQTLFVRARRLWFYRRYRKIGHFLGFSIPPNVFGPGLSIAHHGTIVVNKGTSVGANCRLHVCVNIGTEAGQFHAAPKIGHNVYIGPGAKIYGDIGIADGCAIGANAVVNKSFAEPGSVIAGVPARKIGEVDTSELLIKATEVLAEANGRPPTAIRSELQAVAK